MGSINHSSGDGAITLGTHASDPETATLIFWSKFSTTNLVNRAWLSKRDPSTGAGYFEFSGSPTTSGEACARINYATKDAQAFFGISALTLNKWYYWAATYDGTASAPRVFFGARDLDVVEATYTGTHQAGAGSRVTEGGSNAYLGQNKYQYGINARGQFSGAIGFFAWYDTVLTDAQIIAHKYRTDNWMGTARQMMRPGQHHLIGCPDISGNARNGTIGTGCTVDRGVMLPMMRAAGY